MKTINFKEFPIPRDIAHSEWQNIDAREAVANIIYSNIGGIRAHDLAFKIYRSEGDVTYDDNDIAIIKQVIEVYGMPRLIDGITKILEE